MCVTMADSIYICKCCVKARREKNSTKESSDDKMKPKLENILYEQEAEMTFSWAQLAWKYFQPLFLFFYLTTMFETLFELK